MRLGQPAPTEPMNPNPFLKLIWRSRATARSAAQADRYYDASFGDDELDVFRNHLNGIDYRCLLDPIDPSTNLATNRQHKHCDPRTGRESHRFTHDFSNSMRAPRIRLQGAGQSQLTAHQHQLGLCALQFRQRQQAAIAEGRPQPMATAHQQRALDDYEKSAAQRVAEQAEFARFASDQFAASQQQRCRQFVPFASQPITDEWRAAVQLANRHYAGRWYALQSAVPLDCAAPAAAMRLQLVDGGRPAGRADLPVYSNKFKNSMRVDRAIMRRFAQLEAYRPHWEPAAAEAAATSPSAQPASHSIVLRLDVLQQLMNYPENSSESWAIPFEIRVADGDQICCVFDALLPAAELQLRRRNRRALRRRVLAGTMKLRDGAAEASDKREVDIDLQRPWKPVDWREMCAERAEMGASDEYREVQLQAGDEGGERLRLLVRCAPDALELGAGVVNVSVKCEHQTQLGSEQMTEGELIAEWCRLVCGAGSRTDRFRMDPDTSRVLSVTRLTLAAVEAEMLRLHSLTPATLLARLHQILRTVINFPANQYLMRHSTKPDRTAHILGRVAWPSANSISIEQMLAAEAPLIAVDHFPWTPIDVQHVSCSHSEAKLMPGLFSPRRPFNDPAASKAKPSAARNDRDAIVARAVKKAATVAAAVQQEQQKALAAKRFRKRQKRAKGQVLKAEAAQEEAVAYAQNPYLSRSEKFAEALQRGRQNETINPCVSFDAQGNILVEQLRTAD